MSRSIAASQRVFSMATNKNGRSYNPPLSCGDSQSPFHWPTIWSQHKPKGLRKGWHAVPRTKCQPSISTLGSFVSCSSPPTLLLSTVSVVKECAP